MIIRKLDDILGKAGDVKGPGWNSRRLLLRSDGMGYSVSDTLITAGAEMTLEYKNHLEICYCISGHGEIVDHGTGETHSLQPGTIYALNNHDRHTLRAFTIEDMRLICVFNPALDGNEVHTEDGSYG